MLHTSLRGVVLGAVTGTALMGLPLNANASLQEPDDPSAVPDTLRSDTTLYILEPIEATAERERATAPPVATITVDPAEVRYTQRENPYDLLRRVAGVEVHDQGQGPGFGSNVVLRGFTGDHSSDVLLVVDGVPVNLPVHGHVEGYADWSFLFPGAVSSLRVIHGPSSPLHGDFSIAGAVELYTRPDADGTEGDFSANGFGDVSTWMTTGRRSENGGGLVGVDLRRNEGWRENSENQLGNALFRGWRAIGEGRLEGGLALHAAEWDAPGFASAESFADGRVRAAMNTSDGGDQRRAVVHGRYAAPLGENRVLQVMGWGVASTWNLFLTTPGHVDATGNLYQTAEGDRRWGAGADVELSWTPAWGEVTLGTSVRMDRSEYDRVHTLRRRIIEDEVALDAGHSAGAVYLRWRRSFGNRFGIDLGGRVDHLRYSSMNRLGLEADEAANTGRFMRSLVPADTPPSFHVVGDQGPVGEWQRETTTVLSPKLGARFRATDHWTLMVSTNRGFRSAVGVVGDPSRPPFLAWANEVGAHYERPRVEGHLSFFRTDVTNERIQDPITLAISSEGGSVRQGLEAMLEVEVPGGIRLFGRGTYTSARLDGRYADAHHDHGEESLLVPSFNLSPSNQVSPGAPDDEEEGQRVPGIASYITQMSATVPIRDRFEGRIEWRVTGPYVPIGEPDYRTDPYSTFDAGVRFALMDRVVVDLEMRNILDSVYPEVRSSGYVNPGAPRTFGISIQYQEER